MHVRHIKQYENIYPSKLHICMYDCTCIICSSAMWFLLFTCTCDLLLSTAVSRLAFLCVLMLLMRAFIVVVVVVVTAESLSCREDLRALPPQMLLTKKTRNTKKNKPSWHNSIKTITGICTRDLNVLTRVHTEHRISRKGRGGLCRCRVPCDKQRLVCGYA